MTGDEARHELRDVQVELVAVEQSVIQTLREAQSTLFGLGRARDAMLVEEQATILHAAFRGVRRACSTSWLR